MFAEAKGEGFDVKILKEIIKLRKQDEEERDERESLLDLYMRAMETAAAGEGREGGLSFSPTIDLLGGLVPQAVTHGHCPVIWAADFRFANPPYADLQARGLSAPASRANRPR